MAKIVDLLWISELFIMFIMCIILSFISPFISPFDIFGSEIFGNNKKKRNTLTELRHVRVFPFIRKGKNRMAFYIIKVTQSHFRSLLKQNGCFFKAILF